MDLQPYGAHGQDSSLTQRAVSGWAESQAAPGPIGDRHERKTGSHEDRNVADKVMVIKQHEDAKADKKEAE